MKIQMNIAVWAALLAALASGIWVWRKREAVVARLRGNLDQAQIQTQELAARSKALGIEASQHKQRAEAAETEVKRLRELSKAAQPQVSA